MKRRVLRAHANKRCLRVLSASHLLSFSTSPAHAPSSCSPSRNERGYAVLCDASFLRALLLAYWKTHAPVAWREARRRLLRRAACSMNGPPTSAAAKDAAKATPAMIARLPFGDVPSPSPSEFFTTLLRDAFQDGSVSDHIAHHERHHHHPKSTARGTPPLSHQMDGNAAPTHKIRPASALRFHFFCLPETIAALHRLRASAASPPRSGDGSGDGMSTSGGKGAGASSARPAASTFSAPPTPMSTPSPAVGQDEHQRHHHRHHHREPQDATATWLAASFGDLSVMGTTMSGDGGDAASGSTTGTSTLTFPEIPAAVLNNLLGRFTLLQPPPPSQASLAPTVAGAAMLPTRNESKALADFMTANDALLGRRQRETSDAVSLVEALHMTSTSPTFQDGRGGVAMDHPHRSAAAKRRRRKERERNAAAAAVTALGGENEGSDDDDLDGGRHGGPSKEEEKGVFVLPQSRQSGEAGAPSFSHLYTPRMFFVATQSHDTRRRLAGATPLLRLTTNPDALWIEQRGPVYHYADDDDGRSGGKGSRESRSGTHSPDVPRRSHAERWSTTPPIVPSSQTTSAGQHGRGPPSLSPTHSASASHRTPSVAATVIAAAPLPSRADVAFMHFLGAEAAPPLPPQRQDDATRKHGGGGSGGRGEGGPKRRRQKGVNPLSMKKKQRREVFRAA